jgi:hypothetical protein
VRGKIRLYPDATARLLRVPLIDLPCPTVDPAPYVAARLDRAEHVAQHIKWQKFLANEGVCLDAEGPKHAKGHPRQMHY